MKKNCKNKLSKQPNYKIKKYEPLKQQQSNEATKQRSKAKQGKMEQFTGRVVLTPEQERELARIGVTQEEVDDMFTWKMTRKYMVLKRIRYKTREYWEDRGRWAELVKEEYEDEEYFTYQELIDYYIRHLHGMDIVNHENHEQAMEAGKYFMEYRDARAKVIIQEKKKRLLAEWGVRAVGDAGTGSAGGAGGAGAGGAGAGGARDV